MGNTATKETRQNSPNFGVVDAARASPRARVDRSPAQSSEHRVVHVGHEPSSSRHATRHRKPKDSNYKMIVDRNETVDGGYLFPQGVYHGTQDFKVSVVREMIIKRRLAPFYKGLDSVESDWSDEELLNAINSVSTPTAEASPSSSPSEAVLERPKGPQLDLPGPPTQTQQIWLYKNVHECPICFLVYPRLNATRCCGQDICTECFVQIKRNPPHPPYNSIDSNEATDVLELVSEPSCCPYCAQADLGVIFEAPPFEWGIPSTLGQNTTGALQKIPTSQRPRRTSVPASHPSVVTVDMIRPDWEDKLASARKRLTRKSAAARALHRSALISAEDQQRSAEQASQNAVPSEQRVGLSRPRRDSSLADLVEASRSMSAAQTRALEKKMIEEAIKASLQQK